MTDPGQKLVAYLAVRNASEGENFDGYAGGVLVIDDTGIPREFRTTSPLRPTRIQTALYGESLEQYVLIELIGVPLLHSLSSYPQWCVVDDVGLLDLREQVDFPVLHMQQYGETQHRQPEAANLHRLESDIEGVKPIAVRTHRDFASDYDTVRADVHRLFSRIDPVEPFTRIATAVETLHQGIEELIEYS